ncbi:enoyl-CoA hydratase/isomerase family protein [Planococcus lenghuensis]|uniref:Ethylmalonyl-CoA decarboxylase n=1 Tax=Planococcus lenghuensis TaxID=2213202 RepID=A0A1Q2L187_9BACL|nr:enoyl-CoA hydratase/isomerase family protein [Planococcus lenghuensis]AQQ53807.1 enoyl-CoA hydratase [Planococcus lenghuensis]
MTYRIEETDGVLTMTINRSEIRNAINHSVMDGFEKFIAAVQDSRAHCAVITGAGGEAFCSGGDLSVFHELKTEEEAFPMLSRMADLLYRIKMLPVPVIAVVNGSAVGGGCEIATACDFRLVKREAKCGFIQGTLAITTGWGGGSYLLETLQHDRAMQMLTSARMYSAEELKGNGWATELYEQDTDITGFLDRFRKIDSNVHRAYKQLAVQRWETNGLKSRVDLEVRHCAKLWALDAHHAAVDRFLNKSR